MRVEQGGRIKFRTDHTYTRYGPYVQLDRIRTTSDFWQLPQPDRV